ncbi:DNA gyrase inhibitor YacG [Parvibaculum sp.]|uniref:DNA gyrase inhibitor YacG n=1 Tax=Parvibaculum sp. TaxID=2024848 RepID=UPI000C43865B|nr:DNA gyrase inhibitor YacG [Parvibaculum sp.]MAM95721.1 DNA gyrase inhibitor YacG [Parvibaculum sp.]
MAGEDDGKVVKLRAPRPCPICGARSASGFHPFCSRHCADVDLNRWLKGTYAIPAVEPPDEWDEASQMRPADEDGES